MNCFYKYQDQFSFFFYFFCLFVYTIQVMLGFEDERTTGHLRLELNSKDLLLQ